MSETITIEPAKLKDIEEIYQIEQKSFATPWSYEMFLQEFYYPLSRQLVAKIPTEKVTGYLIWRVDFTGQEAHILDLAVHPGFRRRNIATDLLNRALTLMKKEAVEKVYLEVRENNFAARKLYEKFGFQFIYRRPKYYGAVDGLVYQLNL